MPESPPIRNDFEIPDYAVLHLNEFGRFFRVGGLGESIREVQTHELSDYFEEKIGLTDATTDVFVWVHGWRTTAESAQSAAGRLFGEMAALRSKSPEVYPELGTFSPVFVAVTWPSESAPTWLGYNRIRNRAKMMTLAGQASFFLASLLGYLKPDIKEPDGGTLRASRGFYVHCLGHSFGGRFLTAAIRNATAPKVPRTRSRLSPLPPTEGMSGATTMEPRFRFTVDTALIFQMAAPHANFQWDIRSLLDSGSLSGPLVVTHSKHDRANGIWHRIAEFQAAIGYCGVTAPSGSIRQIAMRERDDSYAVNDFDARIVNVNASAYFTESGLFHFEGAHSDFWHPESYHLALSLAANARR